MLNRLKISEGWSRYVLSTRKPWKYFTQNSTQHQLNYPNANGIFLWDILFSLTFLLNFHLSIVAFDEASFPLTWNGETGMKM